MASTTTAVYFPARLRAAAWPTGVTVLLDLLAFELSLLLAWTIRLLVLPWWPIELLPEHYQGLALGVLLIPAAYYALGLYPGYGINPVERLRLRIQTTAFVFSLLLGWDYLVQGHQWSRGILLLTALAALVLPPLVDQLCRSFLARRASFGEPVIVIGAGKTGRQVVTHLQDHPEVGYSPVAFYDDDDALTGTTVMGLPVRGPICQAAELCGQISVAILAMPGAPRPRVQQVVDSLRFPRVILIPDLAGMQSLWVTGFDMGGILGLQVQRNLLANGNLRLKRTVDIVLSIPLLMFAAPIIAICACLIKLTSPGPAFYRQARTGKDGSHIELLKLRTMSLDAERILGECLKESPTFLSEWKTHFKLEHDPRLIPGIGSLLRRYSIDELPQIWQVLRGQLSLVGPRPFPQYHLADFHPSFQQLRVQVLPGLSGLWQVAARSKGDLDAQETLDTYYIRNWSLWLDYYILLRTIPAVLLAKGAY
jgi:Undecaprenyl-phosphate galactose phosphotransferase WbaP